MSHAPHLQPEVRVAVRNERCPVCNQPISSEKLDEIQARVRAEERERTESIHRRLAEEFASQKEEVLSKAQSEIAAAKAGQQEAVAKQIAIRAEATAAIEKLQQGWAARETAAREEATKAAQAEAAARIAAAEAAVKAATQEKSAAHAIVDQLKADQEKLLHDRLQEQREALEKDKADALNAEKSKSFEEKLKVESMLQDAQRRLQKLTADELGEGAELNLFEELKAAFDCDDIKRVPRGTAGADIIHKVMGNGVVCGTIVYDSKNHNAWRNDHVTKLREDQIAAQADHAVLSSNKFPAGQRQLHLREGVIVANPARVVALAELLRRHIVQLHELRVGNEEREEKTASLYAFVTSDRCDQLLASIETLAGKVLDIDVEEQKSHGATWKKRGLLLQKLLKARGDFCFELDRILGIASDEQS